MERKTKEKNSRREALDWIISIAIAVALAFAVRAWVGQLVIVDGPSMQPTLLTGERVIMGKVEYYFRQPRRGDIVVVKYPGSPYNYIKRVIATAGERIAINDGCVYINGKKLDEPYLSEPINDSMAEMTILPGTVYVMGDNRNNSSDSRESAVGAIPLGHVTGRAYALVWPINKLEKLTQYTGHLEQ